MMTKKLEHSFSSIFLHFSVQCKLFFIYDLEDELSAQFFRSFFLFLFLLGLALEPAPTKPNGISVQTIELIKPPCSSKAKQ
jgi:hypothetical protein